MAKQDLRGERLARRKALEDLGVDPYGGRYETTGTLAEVLQALLDAEADSEQPAPVPVRAAGRIVAVRDMGKSIWLDLRDRSLDKLQVNLRNKALPETFDQLRHLDLGDFLGVSGALQRSRKGEPTIFADGFEVLCKSLEQPPAKWHGLRDVETRYRRRYLDLLSNRASLETFVMRSRIVSWVRRFLDARGFLEVETPMLQTIYGGADARPFTTHHNALDLDLFLRISPECALKRLLVGGMDRVYELNRNFRNEGIDATHTPEFTMLEVYQAYADFEDMMALTESMICELAEDLLGTHELAWNDGVLDLRPPWRRARYLDLLREAGVDPDDEPACRERLREQTRRAAEQTGDAGRVQTLEAQAEALDHVHVLDELFDLLVQPALIQPTFVTHHPVGLTALCKRNRDDPAVHDRFEPIVCGMELGNAYSEQNDPLEQRQALEAEVARRQAGAPNAVDEDFLTALEVGMPPAGGLGIGVDRLVMLLSGKRNLREVILFPTLRPKDEPAPDETA